MRIPSHEFPEGFAEWLQPLFDSRERFVAGLSSAERWVCGRVVDAFVTTGTGPSVDELVAGAPHPIEAVGAALARLDERDMLVLQGDRVLAFYPFSDRPCGHRVRVGAKRFYGMWAGGAIAIPIVHGEGTEAALESACAHCGTPIEFSFVVTANGARSESAAAAAMVEWDPIPTADDRAEPHMLDGMWQRVQFFCSEEHFSKWKAQRPDEAGYPISFHQSARICFEFYGGLRREFEAAG